MKVFRITIFVLLSSVSTLAVEGGPGNCRRDLGELYGGRDTAAKVIGRPVTDSEMAALDRTYPVSGAARKFLMLRRAGFSEIEARQLVVEGYAGCVVCDRMTWQGRGTSIQSVLEPLPRRRAN